MNQYHLVFACLILNAGLLTAAFMRSEPAAGHGEAHPVYPSMNQGGEASRHDGLLLIGWSYGGVQIVLFTVCLTLGLKRGRNQKSNWLVPLTIAATAYLAIFTALMIVYGLGDGRAGTFLGFPTSTSLLVFGMWTVPFLFTGIYVWNFRQWVFDDEDAERFAALKSQYKPEPTDG